jgi:hypothetical protein
MKPVNGTLVNMSNSTFTEPSLVSEFYKDLAWLELKLADVYIQTWGRQSSKEYGLLSCNVM